MNRILFLCSGNYYRSRFAEILFNWHARQRNLPWEASSRGLAIDGRNAGPISVHTMACLRERGIPAEGGDRYPLAASQEDFESAHHIVAVKRTEHWPAIETHFPTHQQRVEYWHVDDLDCAGPEHAIPHLEAQVLALIDRLAPPGR